MDSNKIYIAETAGRRYVIMHEHNGHPSVFSSSSENIDFINGYTTGACYTNLKTKIVNGMPEKYLDHFRNFKLKQIPDKTLKNSGLSLLVLDSLGLAEEVVFGKRG